MAIHFCLLKPQLFPPNGNISLYHGASINVQQERHVNEDRDRACLPLCSVQHPPYCQEIASKSGGTDMGHGPMFVEEVHLNLILSWQGFCYSKESFAASPAFEKTCSRFVASGNPNSTLPCTLHVYNISSPRQIKMVHLWICFILDPALPFRDMQQRQVYPSQMLFGRIRRYVGCELRPCTSDYQEKLHEKLHQNYLFGPTIIFIDLTSDVSLTDPGLLQ
jgi:hypothetical protein